MQNEQYNRFVEVIMPLKNSQKKTNSTKLKNKKRYRKTYFRNQNPKKMEKIIGNMKLEKSSSPDMNTKKNCPKEISDFHVKLKNYSSQFKISIPIQSQLLNKMTDLNEDIYFKNNEMNYIDHSNNIRRNSIHLPSFNKSESFESHHHTFFEIQTNPNNYLPFSDSKLSPKIVNFIQESSSYINNIRGSFDFNGMEPVNMNSNSAFIPELSNQLCNFSFTPEINIENNLPLFNPDTKDLQSLTIFGEMAN